MAEEPSGLKDWPAVLDKHGVQYLILDIHEDRDLLRCFQSLPQWGVQFEDEASALLAHRATDLGSNGLAGSG